MSHPTIDQLREIDLFERLSDDELARFAQAAEHRTLGPVFHVWLPGDGTTR